MDVAKLGELFTAYIEAKDNNNFLPIAKILRENPELVINCGDTSYTDLIASKLDGSFKAKRGAPKNSELGSRMATTTYQVWWLQHVENWSKEATVAELAARRSVSVKTIYKWLRENKDNPSSSDASALLKPLLEQAFYFKTAASDEERTRVTETILSL